jgi:hypothetical protein
MNNEQNEHIKKRILRRFVANLVAPCFCLEDDDADAEDEGGGNNLSWEDCESFVLADNFVTCLNISRFLREREVLSQARVLYYKTRVWCVMDAVGIYNDMSDGEDDDIKFTIWWIGLRVLYLLRLIIVFNQSTSRGKASLRSFLNGFGERERERERERDLLLLRPPPPKRSLLLFFISKLSLLDFLGDGDLDLE